MSSFEEKFYLQNPSLIQRLRRDLRLCCDSLRFFFLWLTKGRRIRRAYRRAQGSNTQLIMEDLFKDSTP